MREIPYAHQSIDENDIQEATDALRGHWITRSEKVDAFEKAIAAYCGAAYAVAFNSASTALAASYTAAGLSPLDRVITTPNSFVASCSTPFQKNANVIFIDIDPKTGNLDLEQAAHNINLPHSRGRTFFVPVHFAGIPFDMQQLDFKIKDPDIVVIEDAAHAIGSFYPDGKTKIGSCAWSQMTVFSFHPAKTITTGEGGMVTTNDPDLYAKLRLYRNNGIERSNPWEYDIEELSGNYNFTEFQAALGLSQLERIEKFIQKRRSLVKAYREKLNGVTLFTDAYDAITAPHLFVIQADFSKKSRLQVMTELQDQGIGTQVHYRPIYRFSFFSKTRGDISPYFPEMEAYYAKALTLPLYYDLTVKDIDKIVEKLHKLLH